MQDATKPKDGPTILQVRVRGRLLTFATAVTLVGVLPFFTASGADTAEDSVVLAAGGAAPAPPPAAASVAAPPAGAAFAAAAGGGLFMFPALSLTPLPLATVGAPTAAPGLQFIRPVDGALTSGFGPRIHPLLGRAMFHTGIDLMATCGTPIRAAADGVVVYASVTPSWGARTIIQHTPSLKTAYGHQSKFLVKAGDVVKQGDIIGLVGTTGWSTGCHLHFDVIVDERYVDPAPYLGLPSTHHETVPFYQGSSSSPTTPATPPVKDGDVEIGTVTPTPTGTSTPTTTPSGTSSPTSTTTGPTTSTPTTTQPTTDPTTSTPDPTTTTTTPDPTTTTTTPDPTTTTSTTSTPDPTTTTSTTSGDSTTTAPDPTTTQPTSEPTATSTSSTATSSTSSTSTSSSTGSTSEATPAPSTTSESVASTEPTSTAAAASEASTATETTAP